MMVNVGVVGAGYWGRNLLRNFQDLGALAAICESDPGNPNLAPYAGTKVYADYGELLSDDSVQAVALATPAALHSAMAKKALDAGKDVYVEKPLALTVREGRELVELAEKKKRIVMVGHILQYHPAVIRLKELITSGELGKIQYIYSNRLNIGKLRTEENILWSFAPHDISVILMLLGEEPVKVSAMGGDYLNAGIYDTTLTSLEFKDGVKGHIFVSWLHPYKEQKLIVVGSRAMAVFDDVSREKLLLYPHTIEWTEGKVPVAHKADSRVIPIAPAEPLKEELKHFLECIRAGKRPKTDGLEGLRVLKILEAAENSLNHKHPAPLASGPLKRPRDLPPDVTVHESAYVDEGVRIGAGTKIWHFSHILKGSRIGENCRIGQNVVIGPNVVIGNNCKIQNNISVYEGVTLEDFVFCGPSMVFTNVFNPRSEIPRMTELRKTLVKRGATIGANATIICGATIGAYSFIGAGSVVTRDVPDYALVMGNPAKLSGWVCRCGEKLRLEKNRAGCRACDSEYKLKNRKLEAAQER